MTRVVFYKSCGSYYGFEIEGHTGLAEAGSDVLCAAISSMTMFVINAIEEGYYSHVDYTTDEERALVTMTALGAIPEKSCERTAFAVGGLIGAYLKQLKALEAEYPRYLHVTEQEKTVK